MRAVVCQSGELRVETVPDPVPGPGQLLLTVRRCGICGSDLHARHHADDLAADARTIGYETIAHAAEPVVFGHEFVGEVVSYGPRTRRAWKPGTLIVALPTIKNGKQVHMTGFDQAAPGGYAEQVVVQEPFAFAVPNGLSPDVAAFTEPLAVAWHAVRRASIGRGDTAVVIGCGPIGLAVILMLKAAGIRTVVASDFSAGRRALATRCGADVVVDPSVDSPWTAFTPRFPLGSVHDVVGYGMDVLGKVRSVPLLPWPQLMRLAERTGQGLPSGPVIFECVGVPGMISHVVTEAPLRSRVVVVGVCMQDDSFRPSVAITKELDLRFVFGYDPQEFQHVLHLLAEGDVDPTPLHTGTVGLDGVAQAFEDLGDPEQHAKILIDPAA